MSARLVEAIRRLIPERKGKPKPLIATSFYEFISFVENEGVTRVEADSLREIKGRSTNSGTVGRIGIYEYSTFYFSQSPTGRSIKFKEVHKEEFGSERGIADAERRGRDGLKGLITAEARLLEIKERLPQVEVSGPANEFNDEKRARMWEEAKTYGITPYPKTSRPVR